MALKDGAVCGFLLHGGQQLLAGSLDSQQFTMAGVSEQKIYKQTGQLLKLLWHFHTFFFAFFDSGLCESKLTSASVLHEAVSSKLFRATLQAYRKEI